MARAGLGHEEGAGEVGIDEFAEDLCVVVFGFDVRVDDAGAVDQDVGATEVARDSGYGLGDGVVVADVEGVELNGDSGGGVEVCGGAVAEGLVKVEEGYGGGAGFGEGLGYIPAETAGSAVDEIKSQLGEKAGMASRV